MKVALVYDRVNKWGGAERVLLALHKMFPQAPLYTSVYDPNKAPWAEVFPRVISSCLKGRHELLGWLMPIVFESFDFKKYDLVISVTSEAAKGIITQFGTRHVCYCLTPTRYLWSAYNEYFSSPIGQIISKPVVKHLRVWDRVAARRPDEIVAISEEVQNRIQKYYQCKSRVIYPPVDVSKFKTHAKGKYYLVVSRLVKYKKIDLAIRVFNSLGLPLLIVGRGNQEKYLKRMAKPNIKFKGQISEQDLIEVYRSAKALIFPQREDFGIVAVEAQAAGVPVIAFDEGGAKETVIDKVTGILFGEQTVDSLTQAIKKFDTMDFKERDLKNNAARFSQEIFRRKFLGIINND